MSNFLKLTALALTAIVLLPSGAHLLELPAKMELARDEYFLVQGLYSGWAWFAVPIAAALAANLALFLAERRRDRATAHYALVAAAFVTASLGVFFALVFPANQATANWTTPTGDWRELRFAWEWGHALGALLVFASLISIGRALIGCRPAGSS